MTTKVAVAVLSRPDGGGSTKLRSSPQDGFTNFSLQNTRDADVPNGTAVQVLGLSGAFSQVQLPSGRQGWVKTVNLISSSAHGKAESPSASRVSGSSSARTPVTLPRAPARPTPHRFDFESPSLTPRSLSALLRAAHGTSDDEDESHVSFYGNFGLAAFRSIGGAQSRSTNDSTASRAKFAAQLSDSSAAPSPDVDMCLQTMKDRVELLQRVSTPMSRSDFDSKSSAQKLQYLARLSGGSESAPRVSAPAPTDAVADQSWQDLEAFCDTLYDCARSSTRESTAWQSKSVTQKIRYLAELKTPMIGNTPLPARDGFVRAHKYPVFLASEAAAAMTDDQRMIMLNFQNSKINQMYKPSQEKHNKWEKELRDCFEKGKAMSPAAIQHVTCQVQSLVEYYQTEVAKPGADKAQMDGWLKQTLKPLMFNPACWGRH